MNCTDLVFDRYGTLVEIHTEETETLIDLSSYVTDGAEILRTYPDLEGFACSLNDGYLTVRFPAGNCAAYIEISL